jgi:H/ACA ribonucleoprotein complex subunit 2
MSLTCGFVRRRLCVIAGNISPIDVITHLPILCEEANVPYIYVNSKEVGYIFLSTIYVHCVALIMSPYNLKTLKL